MLVIIDYYMGNVNSVYNTFKKIGINDIIISNKKEDILNADYIVLPGVGAFSDGIKNLKKLDLIDIIKEQVIKNKIPFLGICLGMQLLGTYSYEHGKNKGLDFIKGEVKKIKNEPGIRVPHVGWNNIEIKNKSFLLKNIKNLDFYFVNSYYFDCDNKNDITSICNHGTNIITGTIEKNNIFGTQFHPEKSQKSGMQLLTNFLNYKNA